MAQQWLTCLVFLSLLLTPITGEHVHTLSDDWKSANKEYMKFQKMNPIHGISSKQ
jgi:Cytochrome c oxidase subunit IV